MTNRRLSVYVCENFIEDYQKVLSPSDMDLVQVVSYPCLCYKHKNRMDAKEIIDGDSRDKIIVCGCNYDLLRSVGLNETNCVFKTSNYCFNHLTNETVIEYILEKQGYIMTTGWLKTWKARLAHQGFDRETAKRFYGEFCNEVVLLDTGVDPTIEYDLKVFSDYVGIPYRSLYVGLSSLKLFLSNLIYEWKEKTQKEEYVLALDEINKKISEYAAVLTIIEQISCYIKKRDIIDKIKELFTFIFGARLVRFIEIDPFNDSYQTYLLESFDKTTKEYLIDTEHSNLTIKLTQNGEILGIIEASDFGRATDLMRYASFATSIARVGALAMSNAIKYEQLEKSRDEVAYFSFHDALTELYNRNHFNQYILENHANAQTAVFVCDIDGLKYVNDHLGHAIGDEMIKAVAQVLMKSFRDTDLVARVGGDEFYIIMFDCTEEAAENAKNRIQYQIELHNKINSGKNYQLGLSVGYVFIAEQPKAMGWEALITEADKNMYAEKARKKG